ncbi:MAG: SGNH/GDSL hydrolase family protein [Clostridia bacterium]|nr:SGNH/GDSL hydrolase family protein [Clostridia bacterium]
MKKLLALLLVFLMLFATFTGCSDKGGASSEPADDVTADVSSDTDDDVSSEPEEDVSSEPEEEPSSEPQYDYEEPNEQPNEPEEEPEEEVPSVELSPVEQRYENLLQGVDETFNKDSLSSEGELGRLVKAIKKAESGKTVKIVFYGNAANTADNTEYETVDATYADQFKEWFEVNVGPCEVYKAGSYNLTSKLACLRVEHDVLRYEPDIVFLDFAVQDAINAAATSNAYAYDNLIRRILQSKNSPAVVSLILTAAEINSYKLNASNPDVFSSASKQHKQLAEYYSLPVIDLEYALWEVLAELVEVTTQIERPLITWKDLGLDNTIYKDPAHSMLYGAVTHLINVAKAKGSSANANFKYPTESYFGNDEYMNTSFLNITQIVEGKAKGYAFDLDFINGSSDELFGYQYLKNDDQNGLTNSILTYKHYIAQSGDSATVASKEVDPHYLKLTVPEIKEDTYLMFVTTAQVGSKAVDGSHPLAPYSPISVICTNASGKATHSGKCLKLPAGDLKTFAESPNCGKTSALLIPKGTTQIEFRIYDEKGSTYILGLATK